MIRPSLPVEYFERNRETILKEWFALLRLPTVGTDPKRLGECARAAAWLKVFLRKLDFSVDIITPESGHPVPVVLAERPGNGTSTVLFYGHYDVQPEDPLEAWLTPPFEPTLINGRVYARGAQDNKGQVFGFLQGVKALIEAGVPLPTLRIVIEGQEESGSEGLTALAPPCASACRRT
ncbi:MAG TPA: M20/M25/M40 family metallo-hydrolase [Kiritimatiellia bacterium]|nr:M20/M25/M40 family metallo-hydrolase [Kiritimatiellia bacterium]